MWTYNYPSVYQYDDDEDKVFSNYKIERTSDGSYQVTLIED